MRTFIQPVLSSAIFNCAHLTSRSLIIDRPTVYLTPTIYLSPTVYLGRLDTIPSQQQSGQVAQLLFVHGQQLVEHREQLVSEAADHQLNGGGGG